jgi:hypothetical protein
MQDQDKLKAVEAQKHYEEMLRDMATKMAPAFSDGPYLTEDSINKALEGADNKINEEIKKAKEEADRKKRQKNAKTLENVLRHEFQTTKT